MVFDRRHNRPRRAPATSIPHRGVTHRGRPRAHSCSPAGRIARLRRHASLAHQHKAKSTAAHVLAHRRSSPGHMGRAPCVPHALASHRYVSRSIGSGAAGASERAGAPDSGTTVGPFRYALMKVATLRCGLGFFFASSSAGKGSPVAYATDLPSPEADLSPDDGLHDGVVSRFINAAALSRRT